MPAAYVFGNSERNILRGPGTNNLDLAIHRSFLVPNESHQLQFRAEAFNIVNHAQLGQPNSTLNLPTTGVISATARPNCNLQFALRYS